MKMEKLLVMRDKTVILRLLIKDLTKLLVVDIMFKVIIMQIYIDYENVGSNGLIGIEKLNEDDSVRVYYSNNSNVSIEIVKRIVRTKAKILFYKLPDPVKQLNLNNALDIILLSDISRTLSNNSKVDSITIISNDNGFDKVLADYNNSFNCKFLRRATIEESLDNSAVSIETKTDLELLFVNELSKYKSEEKQIISIISTSKSRCEINEKICKSYSRDVSRLIMKSIKPLIKVLPGQ